MRSSIPRRQFIRTIAAAALAGPQLTTAASGAANNGAGSSTQTPRLLLGCCAYSFRKYLASGSMSMEDFILKGVELKLGGVDMTVYWMKSTTTDYLTGLRHLAFKNGMPFSGAACRVHMVEADKAKRADALNEIKNWVEVTDILGASHLRIFAGKLPAASTLAQGIDWTVEVMKPACDYAGQRGITLGIEDDIGITQRADVMLEILRRVDSPFVGINLDVSNFIADSDEDQYKQIEACVPYATHAHIRDRFTQNHHTIDLDRIWRIFAKGGYRGYMSAEYVGDEDPMTGVSKLIDQMRSLSRKYSSV